MAAKKLEKLELRYLTGGSVRCGDLLRGLRAAGALAGRTLIAAL